ncbi:MAG: hypothetical protein HY794_10000 [Desulfarculus sp.]|nr:hypothetical protein [Desulfarculus sp.]
MMKSLLASFLGFKGLATGVTLAVIWLIGCAVVYVVSYRQRPLNEAMDKLDKDPGVIEYQVIEGYWRAQKGNPSKFLFTALAGAAGIIALFFLI